MTDEQISLALQDCNQAPIHTPQSLQQFGVVIGIDLENKKIAFCSENISRYSDIKADEILNAKLSDIFRVNSEILLNRFLCQKNNSFTCCTLNIFGKDNFARVVRWNDFAIVELQDYEHYSLEDENLEFLDKTNAILACANSTEELFSLYLDAIRRYIGYDRVMLYRFDDRYDGEVIAESREEYLNSFLGHRFPATDIPQSARDLYAKNPVRFISDIDYDPVKIIFKSPYYEKLIVDLSYINSRAVAPVHIEYLRNMSVKASMSISIIDPSGKLWGLIACHNNSAKYISLHKRLYCEQSSKILSMTIHEREKAAQNYTLAVRNATLAELTTLSSHGFDFLMKQTESELGNLLLSLIDASGVVLCMDKRVIRIGIAPEQHTVLEIVNLLTHNPISPISSTNSLASIDKKYERLRKKASGVLLIRLSEQNYIVWFRQEVQKTIAWAGQPIKNFYDSNGSYKLSPRKSFETWYEDRFLTSEKWDHNDMHFATSLCNVLLKSRFDTHVQTYDLQVMSVADKMFQIFDVMPQAVMMTDVDGVINYTNKAFETMSGFQGSEAIGKYVNILSSGRHDRSFYADIWATILAKKVWSGKIVNARPDGELYRVDTTISPIITSNGDIAGFISIEHEITELANMIDNIAQEKAVLMEAIAIENKTSLASDSEEVSNIKYHAKKELLSQIAHHWRNPLSVISLYVQDLVLAYQLDSLNDEFVDEFKTRCMGAINTMSSVITGFSSFFKPEGDPEYFSPVAIIEEVLATHKSYISGKHINVRFDHHDDECSIFGLRLALSSVILELLKNIGELIELRMLQGADVWIQMYREQDRIILEVSDNCGGIEDEAKVFEPYYSARSVSSGKGIGLFEVKVLVEKYLNGSIEVSNGALGAKFIIRLFVKKGE